MHLRGTSENEVFECPFQSNESVLHDTHHTHVDSDSAEKAWPQIWFALLYLIEKKSYHSYQHIIQIQTRRQEKALKMFQMELGWSQIVWSLFQSPTCQYFAAHRKHRRRHAWEGRRPCTHGAWDQPIIVENLSWKNPKTFDQFCNRSEKKFHHLLRFRTKITSNKRDLY